MVTRRVQTRLERKRTGPEEWLVVTRRPLADESTVEGQASPDATRSGRPLWLSLLPDSDWWRPRSSWRSRRWRNWRGSSKQACALKPAFKRGKGEAGMDAYQVRTWEGWHHHMALTLIAVWFLIGETHRGQQWQGHSVFACNTNESQCLHRLGGQPAARRRTVGMARPPQEPNGGMAERRHHLRDVDHSAPASGLHRTSHRGPQCRLVLTCRPMT